MALCPSPVLKLPDSTKPFVVKHDALYIAVRAVLLQSYGKGLHFMAYLSKKYIFTERNYAPHNKELLAILKTCQSGAAT